MSLSSELRNRIYDVVFQPEYEEVMGIEHIKAVQIERSTISTGPDGGSIIDYDPRAVQPAITRLSRQIRAETLPIFYGTTKFAVNSTTLCFGTHTAELPWEFLLERARQWLNSLGETNRKLVKDLEVRHELAFKPPGPPGSNFLADFEKHVAKDKLAFPTATTHMVSTGDDFFPTWVPLVFDKTE